MPKRRRVTSDSDDDDDEYVPSSSVEAKRVEKKRGKTGPQSKRKGKAPAAGHPTAVADSTQNTSPEPASSSPNAAAHSSALHRIEDADAMREPLLVWYATVHQLRGMPWRKPYNPSFGPQERAQRAYEVWISEIMLQQTQVATVIPYYNRWMEKFPTIQHLADADIETVNALWKGLGYYSRAARLLEGAKKSVNELDGRLPDNAKDMEAKIPGIGRYSAGAICSIAYNECAPVLDGNVHRLLSRVLALYAQPKSKASLDVLWAGAAAMVKGSDRPGDVNQALIELGSTVCKVRDPDCGACPLRARCKAYEREHAVLNDKETTHDPSASDRITDTITAHDVPDIEDLCSLCEPLPAGSDVASYPMKAGRKKAREELDVVSVVEWRHQDTQDRWFLLVRRPEGGLLGGLHEFPTAPNQPRTLTASAMQEIPHKLLCALLEAPPAPYVRPAQRRGARTGAAAVAIAGPDGGVLGSSDSDPGGARTALRIARIREAGDVIHVFSHIKKTYRVQWVVLEGGGQDPPSLTSRLADIGGATSHKEGTGRANGSAGTKRKSKITAAAGETETSSVPPAGGSPRARWLLLKDVPEAKYFENLETGFMFMGGEGGVT